MASEERQKEKEANGKRGLVTKNAADNNSGRVVNKRKQQLKCK